MEALDLLVDAGCKGLDGVWKKAEGGAVVDGHFESLSCDGSGFEVWGWAEYFGVALGHDGEASAWFDADG